MAILKAKYESKDDIPETIDVAELFEERGGEWLLKRGAIEGIKTDADVERVQRSLKAANEEKKTLKAKVEAFGDRDPEEVASQLDELAELRARIEAGEGTKDEEAIQKRIDAAVARKTAPLERQLDAVTKERDQFKGQAEELDGTIKTSRIRSKLTQALTAAKVRTEAIDDVLEAHAGKFEIAEDGSIVTTDQAGTAGLDPEVWLSDMKDKRPHWWPTSTGGGATGSTGGGGGGSNPFSKGAWSKTDQGKVISTDPARAEQYAKQAGFRDLDAALAATQPPQ